MNEFEYEMTVELDAIGVLTLNLTLDVSVLGRDDVQVGQQFNIDSAVWDEGREIQNPNAKPFLRRLVNDRLDNEDILRDIWDKALDREDARREEACVRFRED